MKVDKMSISLEAELGDAVRLASVELLPSCGPTRQQRLSTDMLTTGTVRSTFAGVCTSFASGAMQTPSGRTIDVFGSDT